MFEKTMMVAARIGVRGVSRQDASTDVHEVRGRTCTELVAVQNDHDRQIGPLYIKLDDAWHRFFLDAGLLFWRESVGPEPEDDLLDHDSYIDLARALRVSGVAIARIAMHECRLTILFDGGATLELHHGAQTNDITRIVKLVPGADPARR